MPIRKIGSFRLQLSANDTDLIGLNRFVEQYRLHKESIAYVPHGYGSRLVSFSIRDGDKWIIHSLPTLNPMLSLQNITQLLILLEGSLFNIINRRVNRTHSH